MRDDDLAYLERGDNGLHGANGAHEITKEFHRSGHRKHDFG